MASVILSISSGQSSTNVHNSAAFANKNTLGAFLKDLSSGMGENSNCSVQLLKGDAVAASATLTLDFTSQTDGDTVQIGSLILTERTAGAVANEFNIGASNAASAANAALAINTYGSGLITASSSGAVVTVKCATTGPVGNAIPIIITQSSLGVSASGASLSGGANDTGVAKSFKNFS